MGGVPACEDQDKTTMQSIQNTRNMQKNATPAKTNPGLKMKKELLKSPPGVSWHFFGPEHTRIVFHLHVVWQRHSSVTTATSGGTVLFPCWCTF